MDAAAGVRRIVFGLLLGAKTPKVYGRVFAVL